MAKVTLSFHNGIATSQDELRQSEGFARLLRNIYFKPDDPDRPWRIPGRTLAGTLPSAVNNYGLKFTQFDTGSFLVALANGRLYRSQAVASGLSFSVLQDQTPADWSRTGQYLKALHDGLNNYILYDGSSSRAVVLDSDGNTRLWGMKKPGSAPIVTASTSAGSTVRPNAESGGGFSNPNKAYDADDTTAATATRTTAGSSVSTWSWAAGALAANSVLSVKVATSSLPSQSADPANNVGDAENVVAALKVELSQDSGGTWTTLLQQNVPVGVRWISSAVLTAVNFSTLRLKATFTYTSGSQQASGLVYDIKVAVGGTTATAIDQGTYYYAVTEVYQRTLADGTTIVRESAPSELAAVTVGAGVYGLTLALPARANLDADGYPLTISTVDSLWRRIYRTSNTGTWPNLGLVQDNVKISSPSGSGDTWTDTFAFAGVNTPSPPLAVVQVGATFYPANATPNPIVDGTLFRGAPVVIPKHDPRRLQWSLGGQPEYFPVVHDFALVPTERNDELKGVLALNDVLLVWARTQTYRLQTLPFSTQSIFDLSALKIDILSPNEGLIHPRGYCMVQTQKGYPTAFWVSDTGIWMTDGSLFELRGMGAVKVTTWVDWPAEVNVGRLGEAHLSFDPINQVVKFSYISQRDGLRYELWLHTAPHHWIPSQQDQLVPKITGPHDLRVQDYTMGPLVSGIRQWALDSTVTGKVFLENQGGKDNAAWIYGNGDVDMLVGTGWYYPDSPLGSIHVYEASFYHNNWGAPQLGFWTVHLRSDRTEAIQEAVKQVELGGSRVSRFWVNRSGQGIRVFFRQRGQAVGAIGPIVFEGESTGDLEEF